MAGLRFAVKDNIDVAGWPTTAACPAFAGVAMRHATVVQLLLDAGASLVGKTNLDQFACGLNGTRSPYGAVPNAFDPAYVSGGSSSGSAYVVATGQVDFALGTDTAGSGRVPAGLNNLVGLKPTRGLVSAHGLVPAAQSVDCVSVFATTVALAMRVLAVIAGPDPQDPYSRTLAQATPSWAFGGGVRLGVPDRLDFCGDVLAEAAFTQALEGLRALGADTRSVPYAPLAEAAAMLYDSALVAERYAAVRTFFDAQPEAVLEPVRGILASGRGHSAADWCDAQVRLQGLRQRAQTLWADVDVLVVPTTPTHYQRDQMLRDPVVLNRQLGLYTNFVNLLDWAALAVPASLRPDGLPFGITLIAPAGHDWALAALGQRFHHATGLPQGALGQPLPPAQTLPLPEGRAPEPGVRVAVVGAHLSGMPLNGQLTQRGARLLGAARTSPDYRLYALPGTQPPKPGLLRVAAGTGAPIELELWELPLRHYGSFVAGIPAPLGVGMLTLADGSAVQGFLCEAAAVAGAEDISQHGGWRAYLASRGAASPNPLVSIPTFPGECHAR